MGQPPIWPIVLITENDSIKQVKSKFPPVFASQTLANISDEQKYYCRKQTLLPVWHW